MSKITVTHEHFEGQSGTEVIRKLLEIPEDKFLGFVIVGIMDDEPVINPETGGLEFSPYVIRSNSHDPQHISMTLMSVAMSMAGGTFMEMSAPNNPQGENDERIDIPRTEG